MTWSGSDRDGEDKSSGPTLCTLPCLHYCLSAYLAASVFLRDCAECAPPFALCRLLSVYYSIVLSISVHFASLHPVCFCLLACGLGCLSLLGCRPAELPCTLLSFPITCWLAIPGQHLPRLPATPHPRVPLH
ncbi:hypothetical protein E2C01_028969 [Portunus trituberculatus]|uniref:Uncharacterized protein n=1 Tax=Portunus trituberculatus TaxID=210409 RepID=A0A5B7EMY2_PORTR|nr:hypothetical protein [Portunus trituberculatus]